MGSDQNTCPVHEEFSKNLYHRLDDVDGRLEALSRSMAGLSKAIYVGVGIWLALTAFGPQITKLLNGSIK